MEEFPFRQSATASAGLSANRPYRSRNGTTKVAIIAWQIAGETGGWGIARREGETCKLWRGGIPIERHSFRESGLIFF
jgi:hypothetical protein